MDNMEDLKRKIEDALWGENSTDFTFVYNTLEEANDKLFKYIEHLEEVCESRYHLIKGYKRIVSESKKDD